MAKAPQKIEDNPKRCGPRPPPPVPAGIDPLSGALRIAEAGGVIRKSPATVRKLADAGELEWIAGKPPTIWGPSIVAYWERNRIVGKRPSVVKAPEPGKRGRGRRAR
jgi:hypothetical protein